MYASGTNTVLSRFVKEVRNTIHVWQKSLKRSHISFNCLNSAIYKQFWHQPHIQRFLF